jgi:hypothetical protein
MDLEHELLAIERPLWTNDAAIYESSFVEDAVLVFAETGVIRREPALAAIRPRRMPTVAGGRKSSSTTC